MTEAHRNMSWLLPFRLATAALLGLAVLWLGLSPIGHLVTLVYIGASLLGALFFVLRREPTASMATLVLVAVVIVLELVVESFVVTATGGISSPFSALYILTIVSAALTFRLAGTLLVASASSFAYAYVAWMQPEGSTIPGLGAPWLDRFLQTADPMFYSVFLHVLVFYLVAFVSGFLAERLRDRDRQLASTFQALRRARLETDDILRHLNSGLLTIDTGGRVLFFNHAAERVLGYAEEEVRGRHCRDVFASRMPRLADLLVDGLRSRIEYPRREIMIETPAGKKLPLGLSTSCLTEPGNSLRGVIAIFSDITEAKRLEAKVRAADRMAAIGELSASIAHEIRNPLASISGSVEVLRDELQVTGENARLMDLIVKESERLSHITTEFLQYAKIDQPPITKVELCHILAEVLQLVRHHPGYRPSIALDLDVGEAVVYALGEENLLKQLLLNLVTNAVEALGDGGDRVAVSLRINAETGFAEVVVADNGCGLSPELKRRIYQPFFSTKKTGTGLGLAIVHRIATALNLRLNVESEPGAGCRFRVDIPLWRSPAAPQQPHAEPEPSAAQPTLSA